MTIDEAIRHCEEVAEENVAQANRIDMQSMSDALDKYVAGCRECAANHIQLAEWLKELKELKETKQNTIIHAYWIRGKECGFKTHNPTWYCSNCGSSIRYDTTPRTYQKQKKPVEEVNCFCRKCGAKMDLPPIYERDDTTKEDKEKPESNTKAFEEIKEQFVDKKKDFHIGDKVWVRKYLNSSYAEIGFITEAGETQSRVFFDYSNKEMVLDNRLLIKA